jgi:GNAT superfamily N-acetyltransferase
MIHAARIEDAALYADLLRRSITDLCIADHQNDPAKLEPWLANKTADQVRDWIARDDLVIRVAILNAAPAGFGLAARSGDIRLMYTAPEARFQGVSTALLAHMESDLHALEIATATLTSTGTAHTFYKSRGWFDRGAPEIDNGMTGFPMAKRFS